MIRWWLLVACWLGGLGTLLAQHEVVLIGAEDGETLIGASVRSGDSLTVTDVDGRFRPRGKRGDSIRIEYVGYAPQVLAYEELLSLDTVVLSSAPYERYCILVVGSFVAPTHARQTERIDRIALERTQPLTSADALANLSGVYVQKSQLGGGSPVLRGFEANRVLLVVDGIRMNNAIFRGGHLQNGISVDPASLEGIDLVYGPAALEYGSDALGGVVAYRTRETELENYRGEIGLRADAGYGYSTAARARQLYGGFSVHREDWAALSRFSVGRFGDLRTGGWRPDDLPDEFGVRPDYLARIEGRDTTLRNPNPLRQVGSGYRQFNLLQKFLLRTGEDGRLRLNLQYSTTSEVPRYDALTERRDGGLRWARWDYGPQTRALAALRFDHRDGSGMRLFDRAVHRLHYQFMGEDRLTRRRDDPLTEHSLVDVGTLGYHSSFRKQLGNHALLYGWEGRVDVVETAAFLTDPTGERRPDAVEPRYPGGGSSLATAGVYLRDEFKLRTGVHLTGGLRYTRQWMQVRYGSGGPIEWPADYYGGITNRVGALTGALGAEYRRRGHTATLGFSQGFRAPNVDDFAKFRERNGQLQLPNPDLRPERINSLEAGYRWVGPRSTVRLTGYHGWLRDAIIRTAGVGPDGRSTIVSRGEVYGVQVNANAEWARVFGGSFEVEYRPSPYWTIGSGGSWQRGRREQLGPLGETLDLPQDHIPPAYGRTVVRYEDDDRWSARLQVNYQLGKEYADYAVSEINVGREGGYFLDRTGTSDNLELTPFDPVAGRFTGSPGWWTVSAYLNYQLHDRWTLRLKGENLLDRFYRPFAAGISAAGRDLGVGVSWAL